MRNIDAKWFFNQLFNILNRLIAAIDRNTAVAKENAIFGLKRYVIAAKGQLSDEEVKEIRQKANYISHV